MAAGLDRHLDHGERRRVGRKDGARLDGVVEFEEQRLLRGEVLDHRLDDEVAVREVCDPLGAAYPTEHGVAVLFAQPTLVDLALQGLLEPGDRGVSGRLVA